MKHKPSKDTLRGWGILAVVAAVFTALKLSGITSWSWLWVLSPLWLPLAVAIVGTLLMIPVLLFQEIIFHRDRTLRKEERDDRL